MIEAVLGAAVVAAAACAPLQALMEETLGPRGEIAAGAVAYVGLADAPGCTVSLRGGTELGAGVFEIASKIDSALGAQGWRRDPSADADGAGATAAGYVRDDRRLTVTVERDQPEAGPYAVVLGLRSASDR